MDSVLYNAAFGTDEIFAPCPMDQLRIKPKERIAFQIAILTANAVRKHEPLPDPAAIEDSDREEQVRRVLAETSSINAEGRYVSDLAIIVDWVIDLANSEGEWTVGTAYVYTESTSALYVMVPDRKQPLWEGDVILDHRSVTFLHCTDFASTALYKQILRETTIPADWFVLLGPPPRSMAAISAATAEVTEHLRHRSNSSNNTGIENSESNNNSNTKDIRRMGGGVGRMRARGSGGGRGGFRQWRRSQSPPRLGKVEEENKEESRNKGQEEEQDKDKEEDEEEDIVALSMLRVRDLVDVDIGRAIYFIRLANQAVVEILHITSSNPSNEANNTNSVNRSNHGYYGYNGNGSLVRRPLVLVNADINLTLLKLGNGIDPSLLHANGNGKGNVGTNGPRERETNACMDYVRLIECELVSSISGREAEFILQSALGNNLSLHNKNNNSSGADHMNSLSWIGGKGNGNGGDEDEDGDGYCAVIRRNRTKKQDREESEQGGRKGKDESGERGRGGCYSWLCVACDA